MPQRAWWAVVIALFCLPLFYGLNRTDLRGDEAIYSFAVDRTLETGSWLIPKSSPHDNQPFFEKPPLKIWLVAGGIRSGLLPYNEFGLRFWDALFGSLAFLYVFALGQRIAGPLCGVAAVAMLFVDVALFTDGLRRNNTDSPLLLAYCGGLFHFVAASEPSRTRWHVIATALYFVLGFLTKFVAALFLPLIVVVSALRVPRFRDAGRATAALWIGAVVLSAALIAPWFLYAWAKHGSFFWSEIVGAHVYRRLTTGLDPNHLHPRTYYATELVRRTYEVGTLIPIAAGVLLVVWIAATRRTAEHILLTAWGFLPLVLLSVPASKLYHYLFPFLPAFALCGGLAVERAAALVQRWAEAMSQHWQPRIPSTIRGSLWIVAALLVVIALATLLSGDVELLARNRVLAKNSQLFRPLAVCAVAIAFSRKRVRLSAALASVAVLALLPLHAYVLRFNDLRRYEKPMQIASRCLQTFASAKDWRGLAIEPQLRLDHSHNYYFRRVQPWVTLPPQTDVLNDQPSLTSASSAMPTLPTTRSIYLDAVRLGLPKHYQSCGNSKDSNGIEPIVIRLF